MESPYRYERHFARCSHDANPPTVVLLPGLFAGGWIWDRAWDFLVENASFDLLRFSDSLLAREEPVESVEVWRNWLKEVLDSLNIQRPILCGNSLGALIVVDFSASHPERVHAAIASGAPGMSRMPLITLDQIKSHGLLSKREARRIAKNIFYDPSRIPQEVIDRVYNEMNTPRKIRVCLQALKVAKDYDVSTLLPNIHCPLLMVWGDHDRITPLADWKPHLAKLEQCRVVEVEKCGHSPMVEKPDDFNKVLLEFLQQYLQVKSEDLLLTP